MRVLADVVTHEDRLGVDLDRDLHCFRDDVATPQNEPRSPLGERGVEILERVAQERDAIRPGEVALHDPVVEHEERNDPLGLSRGCRESRVIVDAKVAREENDRRPHPATQPKASGRVLRAPGR